MVSILQRYQSFIKQTFYPTMKLEISSTFYFKMLFTGNYDRGCGFTFNIMDINDENLYHLDVRCNNKNSYRTMIQADKRHGKWSDGVTMKLPDLRKENDVYVSVTDKYFELTINSIEIKPKFATDLTRLSSFKYFLFYSWGNCIQLHAANSYMSNEGQNTQTNLALQGHSSFYFFSFYFLVFLITKSIPESLFYENLN